MSSLTMCFSRPLQSRPTRAKYAIMTHLESKQIVMTQAIGTVQTLQRMNKDIASRTAMSFEASIEERKLRLNEMITSLMNLKGEIVKHGVGAEGLSAELAQKLIFEPGLEICHSLLEKLTEIDQWKSSPSGLTAVILPVQFSFRIAIEALAKSLFAGNPVIFKFSVHSMTSALLLSEVVKSEHLSSQVGIVCASRQDVGSFFTSYPSIKAILFYGNRKSFDGLMLSPHIMAKKIAFNFGGQTSAVVIDKNSENLNLSRLLSSCYQVGSSVPWRVSKIFLLNELLPQFRLDFVEQAKKLPAIRLSPKVTEEKARSILERIKVDLGKLISGGELKALNGNLYMTPAVVIDLPNCSELQQEEIELPIVTITTVKYGHEMIKWLNNGYFGYAAQIYGPKERAIKLAAKINCGQIWINSDFQDQNRIPIGMGPSLFGLSSYDAEGDFFLDKRVIDFGAEPGENSLSLGR